MQLHVFDCGRIEAKGARFVSPHGTIQSIDAIWSSPCVVVQHPAGILLWDAGLPDSWIDVPGGVRRGGFRFQVTRTWESCLGGIGIVPSQITHLAFSHLHLDHTGNAGMFPRAKVFVQERELLVAAGPNPPPAYEPAFTASLKDNPLTLLDGDHDVFGDGTVRLLTAPGHSAGHQVLLLTMPRAAPMVFCGDLWYSDAHRRPRLAPIWNHNLPQTWQSMNRIEQVIADTGARLVIAHDPASIVTFEGNPLRSYDDRHRG